MAPHKTGRSASAADAAERRVQVWELRKAGASYRVIAQRLGVSHEQVRKDCQRVIADLAKDAGEIAADWRAVHLQRLEDMLLATWARVRQGDHVAITDALRVLEREANLMGLDAPKQVRVDIVERVRQYAAMFGIDPEEAVAEAENVIRQSAGF